LNSICVSSLLLFRNQLKLETIKAIVFVKKAMKRSTMNVSSNA
jgi:hypothetical protein